MNYLAVIEKLPIDVIQEYNKTGKSGAILPAVQKYIDEINDANRIKKFEDNISRAANKLILEHPHLAFQTARQRVYDAINFFNLNNTVKNEAWDNIFADKLLDLANMAIAMKNITEARRCVINAHALRTNRDEEAYDGKYLGIRIQVVSCEVTHERLGIDKENKKQLAGHGWSLIKDMNVSKKDKKRVWNELVDCLGVDDVEFEEMSDE